MSAHQQIVEALRRSRLQGQETLCLRVQWAPEALHTRRAREAFALWLRPILGYVQREALALCCDPVSGVVLVRLSAPAGRDAAALARCVARLMQHPGDARSIHVVPEGEARTL